MIVPDYWAEAKERVVIDGRSKTYMRFGWSDISEQDALANARERVAEAAARARRGEKVRRVDHKVAYNGAEGLPIREEVIERHGDTVITRNSYGALCLNTPNVLFADIDITTRSSAALGWAVFLLAVAIGYSIKALTGLAWTFWVSIVLGLILAGPIATQLTAWIRSRGSSAFDKAYERIREYADKHPARLLRVYRTPNGYRVLVMNETFDPKGSEAHAFMTGLGSDPLYMRMCKNQSCFRARISPKPWRIGVDHIRPRPGIWPINPERLDERHRWVQNYDSVSANFASCRYEATLGSGRSSRECESVRKIHDRHCKPDSGLALA